MEDPIYQIRSLQHCYAGKTVLEIDRLAVQPASIVGLIGPNGSGKSTLLRLLGLIESPTQGKILFNGRPVGPFSNTARFQITLLPQEPFLLKRSVFKNVAYGLRLRGDSGHIAQRVKQALSLVGLESEAFIRRPWYALSGGETQRVALAARLALNPKVLLLDEPSASIDAASAQLIKEASLKVRREFGTTLVISSHDWQWLYEICDEILHLFKGRIFGNGQETIIFGPWRKLDSGRWGKPLSGGQQLLVPPPPHQDAAAVIDIHPADPDRAAKAGADIVLKGTVSRISLEGKSGRLLATILVGDLPVKVRLTLQQGKERDIFPGKPVSIAYRFDRVRWI